MDTDEVRGLLLGLACGDALGRPVEFESAERIAADAPLQDALDHVDVHEELAGALAPVARGETPRPLETSGYVVHTLQTALHDALGAAGAEEAIVTAVNRGGDADTVGGSPERSQAPGSVRRHSRTAGCPPSMEPTNSSRWRPVSRRFVDRLTVLRRPGGALRPGARPSKRRPGVSCVTTGRV